MIDRKIIKFQLRRGTEAERTQIVFDEAELIYATDSKIAYVGDGITLGGVPLVNNDNNNVTSLTANDITLRAANVRLFEGDATASGKFLVMQINGTQYGIRLWDIPTS